MKSESQKKAQKRYDQKNTKQVKMKLNKNTDQDIIRWLELQENKQGYIKDLIRKDMQ